METPIKSFLLSNGNILNIYQGESFENPQKEWDMLGHCEFFHRNYDLGNDNEFSDIYEAIEYTKSKNVISLPVYMYEHSGITIKTSPFGCRFDSGLLGFIWVTKQQVRNEYNVKRITKKIIEKTISHLEGQIELLNQYITGDVYSFEVVDTNNNEIDSCCGFYGDNFKDNGLFDHALNNNITVVKEIKVTVNSSLEYHL